MWIASCAVASGPWLAAEAAAETVTRQGRVFVDVDGDGRPGPGEEGLAGVRVSDGAVHVETDAEGAYTLSGDGRFILLTQPRGIACAPWYRETGGDFACQRIPDPDAFFFVQISDAHVYDDALDFERFSRPAAPWWVPDFAASRIILHRLAALMPDNDADDVLRILNEEMGTDHGPGDVLQAWLAAFVEPGSPLGAVADAARDAMAEVRALGPAFVVSTGDLILEGNHGTPDAARRWMDFYDRITRETGLPFFHSIGNNELVGSEDHDTHHTDPDYGKGLYRRHFGPTQYAFDRGRIHFVVADSHTKKPRGFGFYRLRAPERHFLEADLHAHRGRTQVLFNHEPFTWDPDDPTRPDVHYVRDEGLLARFAVPYAITGHLHRNAVYHDGTTTHVSTGALSGMRWALPTRVHERGMRLFWADGDRLFSAWKTLDTPAVGFVVAPGGGSASLVPSGAERAAPDEIVAVAVDARGPFERIEIHADGEPIETKRWGRYFVWAQAPRDGARLEVVARRADGTVVWTDGSEVRTAAP